MNALSFGLALVFFIFALLQGIEYHAVVRRIRSDYPEVWRKMGAPDLSSPNGQWVVNKFILGLSDSESYPNERIKHAAIRIRFYAAVSLVAFLALAGFLIASGA